MNKKIRGAKKKVLDGITFDSHLEATCYRELKSAGIEFEYNSNTYEIFPGVRLNKVNFIESKVKNRGYNSTIFKTLITVENKNDKSSDRYYITAEYNYKDWDIKISEPNKIPQGW